MDGFLALSLALQLVTGLVVWSAVEKLREVLRHLMDWQLFQGKREQQLAVRERQVAAREDALRRKGT